MTNLCNHNKISVISARGFTLVEVMVATAVVAITTVMIYETFLGSLDLVNYCYDYLNVAYWVENKMWETQNDLTHFGAIMQPEANGVFIFKNKKFRWAVSYSIIGTNLFKVDSALYWQEGTRFEKVSRTGYAVYEKPEL